MTIRPKLPVPRVPVAAYHPKWTVFVDLFQFLLAVGAAVLVYWLAGGRLLESLESLKGLHGATFSEVFGSFKPVTAGFVTFFAINLSDTLTRVVLRRRHNLHVNAWYAAVHPEEVPTAVQVAHIGEMLAAEGPLHPGQIQEKLTTPGGPWSGVPPLTRRGVTRALGVGGQRPDWLAPRTSGEHPYSHVSNPYVPEKETAAAD